jgi:N-acyl-D-amino-acid deacylase
VFMTSEETPDMHIKEMAWLDEQRAKGLNIYGQAVMGRSWQEFTAWVLEGSTLDFMPVAREYTALRGYDEKMVKAADRQYRQRFRETYDPRPFEVLGGPLPDYVVVSMGKNGDPHGYAGKSLAEIGRMRGTDFIDAFFDLNIVSDMDFTFKKPRGPSSDPIKVLDLIKHPQVLLGVSDGGAHSKFNSAGCWMTDLLIWLVRENKLVTQEEMHYRLSNVPCAVFGLTDRGVIAEGKHADLIVYDLDELYFDRTGYDIANDMAGGDWRRKARAGGYRWIIVNGQVTYENDVRRDQALPGKLLRIGQPRSEDDRRRFAAE